MCGHSDPHTTCRARKLSRGRRKSPFFAKPPSSRAADHQTLAHFRRLCQCIIITLRPRTVSRDTQQGRTHARTHAPRPNHSLSFHLVIITKSLKHVHARLCAFSRSLPSLSISLTKHLSLCTLPACQAWAVQSHNERHRRQSTIWLITASSRSQS